MTKEEIKVGDVVVRQEDPDCTPIDLKDRTFIVVTEIKGAVFWGIRLTGTDAPRLVGYHILSGYTKVSPETLRSCLSEFYIKYVGPNAEEETTRTKEPIRIGDVVILFAEKESVSFDLKYQTLIVVTEIHAPQFCGIKLTGKDAPIGTEILDLKDYFKIHRDTVIDYLDKYVTSFRHSVPVLRINPGDLVRKTNMGDADALVCVTRVYASIPGDTESNNYMFDGIIIAGVDTPRYIIGASFPKYSVVPSAEHVETLRQYRVEEQTRFPVATDSSVCFSVKHFNEFKAKTEAELRQIHRIMAETHLPGIDIENMLEVLNGVDIGDFQWTTRQGRTVAIKHMTDEHIHNAINHLKQRNACSVCCPEGHSRRYTSQFYLELFKRELQRRAEKSHEQARRMSDFLNKE